jgi:hypothetical protein
MERCARLRIGSGFTNRFVWLRAAMSTALALLAALAGYVALVLLIAGCTGFNEQEQKE